MKRTQLDYIRDIIDSMERAQRFVAGMEYATFANDEKTNYAVVRAVEILGEASKQVPEDVRFRFPEIPWREMAGTRDKVAHAYFGVDLEVVWDTVMRDFPSSLPALRKCLRVLEEEESSE